jgi:hypothetical protein
MISAILRWIGSLRPLFPARIDSHTAVIPTGVSGPLSLAKPEDRRSCIQGHPSHLGLFIFFFFVLVMVHSAERCFNSLTNAFLLQPLFSIFADGFRFPQPILPIRIRDVGWVARGASACPRGQSPCAASRAARTNVKPTFSPDGFRMRSTHPTTRKWNDEMECWNNCESV